VSALHDAVDRHDLAGAHEDDVAGDDRLDGDLREDAAAAPVGDPRRAPQQGGQLPASTGRRGGFERVAAREHERDDRAGEELAQRERAHHREQRDRVDADIAPV
jgi:hypothetical protein